MVDCQPGDALMVKSGGGGGGAPDPDRLLTWTPAASVTESVPAKFPVLPGLKVTVIEQDAPMSSDAPQLLVAIAKAEAFAPPSVTEVMPRATVPS